MSGSIFGVAKVTVDGIDYGCMAGAELDLGDDSHTAQFASGKMAGVSAEPSTAKFTGNFVYKRGVDYEPLRKLSGGAVEFETDTGAVYSVSEAYHEASLKIQDGGRGMPASIFGNPAVKTAG